MSTGSEQILRKQVDGSGEDDPFQRLLLEFSSAAAKGLSPAELLLLFCRSTRSYFGVSGSYVWHLVGQDQLQGAEADGWMAERFRNARLKAHESAVTNEAIRQKRAVFINGLNTARYPIAAEYNAKSVMAVPLVVFDEVIGAAVFLHTTEPCFFSADRAAKATILAAQLGSFLEAARLSGQAREEQRRAGILAEVAHSLHSEPDIGVLVGAVADHLRALLRTPLVCILVREAAGFDLWAVATENPALSLSVRARHDRKSLYFASDLANRAINAGEPISVSVDPAAHSLADLVPPGTLLAAPFRTSSREGAVLVYPRREGAFSTEEKKLLRVITSFAAIAVSNAELYAKARAQAHELHQIINIASELGSITDLDQFMSKFIHRASDFLGFGRAFVGLIEHDRLEVRWSFVAGAPGPAGYVIPEGILTRAIQKKEVLWAA